MNIHIEVYFTINGIRVLRQGTFRVKKDEVNTACKFIQQLQKDYPYDLILRKVLVGGKRDITEEVNEFLK